MTQLPLTIFKYWLHSYEDKSEKDIEIYRPKSYPFKRSRGRKGFEIKPNGEFISYDIAAANGYDINIGQWKFEEPNQLEVTFSEQEKINSKFIILSCDENILKIRKIQ
jgi:hypothetical protein